MRVKCAAYHAYEALKYGGVMTQSPLKIAQVIAGASHGGAESFYTRLVCGLTQAPELKQHAFLRPHPDRINILKEHGVATSNFRFGGPLDIYDSWRFRRQLRQWQPDIVLTWMSRASSAVPRGDYLLINRLGSYYNLKHYRQADYWIGISQGICDYLIEGGIPAERVIHIPNFADEREVTALPRSSFETPEHRPILLAAGRLHKVKGFDILLSALAKVPEPILWLAGTGPEEKALKEQCHALRLTDRVRFLGWRNDVPSLMRTADAFVCSSRHEGLGSIVLESWLHHCPIISTRAQGPQELITHEKNGLLSPIDDADSLSEAIIRVLSEPKLRHSLITAGATLYHTQYSEDSILKAYRDFFSRICTR